MNAGVSAIVLAGGRSSRFGSDKLAAAVGGRPLIAHTIGAVALVATEVLVVTAADGRSDAVAASAAHVGARLITDPEPFGGPVVGLRAGAAMARFERLLVVGGDMPWLVPAVLRLLLEASALPDVRAAALGGDDGPGEPGARGLRPEAAMSVHPLPVALRRTAVLEHGRAHPGRVAMRGLLEDLDVRVIRAAAWRASDPDGTTVRDVDRPEDVPRDRMGAP